MSLSLKEFFSIETFDLGKGREKADIEDEIFRRNTYTTFSSNKQKFPYYYLAIVVIVTNFSVL